MKSLLLSIVLILCVSGCGERMPASALQSTANQPLFIDKNRAFDLLKEIVAIGPRPVGSEQLAKTARFIEQKCQEYGYTPEVDSWQVKTAIGQLTLRNIEATLAGQPNAFIIVGSHYDSKRMPSTSTFQGANDSASSTALLLEIMRVLKTVENWDGPTIRFAFFDGEEAIEKYSDTDGLLGSKRMALALKNSGEHVNYKAMILLDMIGDADLSITLSPTDDSLLIQQLLEIAEHQGTRQYFNFYMYGSIIDDHVPFKDIGIPAVDIIDMNFGPNNSYWHTDMDTIDKVSPESLEIVGNVVLALLQKL